MKIGDRVTLHPATDWWMRGARYGTLVKIGRKYLHVKLDVPWRDRPAGKIVRFAIGSHLIESVA